MAEIGLLIVDGLSEDRPGGKQCPFSFGVFATNPNLHHVKYRHCVMVFVIYGDVASRYCSIAS